jgi:hypothetical protein
VKSSCSERRNGTHRIKKGLPESKENVTSYTADMDQAGEGLTDYICVTKKLIHMSVVLRALPKLY